MYKKRIALFLNKNERKYKKKMYETYTSELPF